MDPRTKQDLFHVLLSEINEYVSRCSPAILRGSLAPIGIDFVFWSILGIVAVRKANIHWKWRIAHEFRASRHDRIAVRVRVNVSEEFVFSLLKIQQEISNVVLC